MTRLENRQSDYAERRIVRIEQARSEFWRRCRCSRLLIAPGVMTRIAEPGCPRHGGSR